MRLIVTAIQWLREGKPVFVAEGGLREKLLAIKRAQVPLEEVLATADAMTPGLENARQTTVLPRRPDVGRADALLRRIGEEIASRWIGKVPGPFGRDARTPPEIVWKDAP